MVKRATVFELVLPLRDSGISANRWLYGALRAEILEGRLRPGSRLPATRDLARQYGLARGTIVNAFEQLKSEGYVDGNVGSGTYVSKILPDELLQIPRDDAPEAREARRETVGHRHVGGSELRALAHGIFPPLLMSGGLAEALPAAATRSALPTDTDIYATRSWLKNAFRSYSPSAVFIGGR